MDLSGAAAGLAERESGGPDPRRGGRLIQRGHALYSRGRYGRNMRRSVGDGRVKKLPPERERPEDRPVG